MKAADTLNAWKDPEGHIGATQYEVFDGISSEIGVYTTVIDSQMLKGSN